MERNRGSVSEIAMDVVILDRDTNRVTVVRYGVERPCAMRQLPD